jgi:F0F1-type ATP synthase assembly protein I
MQVDWLVQHEWLVIELLVLGFLAVELILLRRDTKRAERAAEAEPKDEPPDA